MINTWMKSSWKKCSIPSRISIGHLSLLSAVSYSCFFSRAFSVGHRCILAFQMRAFFEKRYNTHDDQAKQCSQDHAHECYRYRSNPKKTGKLPSQQDYQHEKEIQMRFGGN